jgi:hypothetical protein
VISALPPVLRTRNRGVMTNTSKLAPAQRRQIAENAMDSLTHPADRTLVQVRCGRGHHVAAVFDTYAGPVFQSVTGPHAHGSRDFADDAHGPHRHGTRYIDLLASDDFVDDALPASCECGPHTLSRARLQQAIANVERTVRLP